MDDMKTLGALLIAAVIATSHSSPAMGLQAEDIRAKLATLNLRQADSMDDYVRRARQMRILLPQMAAFYRASSETLRTARKKYSGRPDLIKLADFIEKLNERDAFGFQLLKEELRLARILEHLPPEKQTAFWDERIKPLAQVEDNIVNEEVEMAIDGMNRGLKLPPDILESLKMRTSAQKEPSN
jgi:hypothetical protein